MPYPFHLKTNSAYLVNNVALVESLIAGVDTFLILLTELFILFGISTLLFVAEPYGALGAIIVLGISSYFFYFITKKKLKTWGSQRHYAEAQKSKHILQGFGAIKDLKNQGVKTD